MLCDPDRRRAREARNLYSLGQDDLGDSDRARCCPCCHLAHPCGLPGGGSPLSGGLKEGIRILPDTVRLLRRLTADRATPRGIRLRLGLLFAYLAMPIDLIPDFIPGIGYADDAIIVGATLRSAVRHAGPTAVRAHWPRIPERFATLWRLARLDEAAAPSENTAQDSER